MTLDQLITKGLLTRKASQLIEPVTEAGIYKARNGFWYEVSWQGGRMNRHSLGKSAAYIHAEHEFLGRYGPIIDERSSKQFDAFLAQRFEEDN